jgi:putative ABC transport system ATP-binding protein
LSRAQQVAEDRQPEAGSAAVLLRGVVRQYGRGNSAVRALDDVSLTVAHGDFLAIMGPSGSGKSTLLNLVGALDRPDSGSILVGGRDIAGLSVREASCYRRADVGFIFQSFNLLPRLTVLENVAMPLMFDGVVPSERARRALEVLAEMGMEHRLQHRPPTLSGGEKQRVAIARALVNQPQLLLADEPTGNLDSRNAEAAMEVLVGLNRDRGQTILLITHEADVSRHAGHVVHMRDGRLVDAPQAG